MLMPMAKTRHRPRISFRDISFVIRRPLSESAFIILLKGMKYKLVIFITVYTPLSQGGVWHKYAKIQSIYTNDFQKCSANFSFDKIDKYVNIHKCVTKRVIKMYNFTNDGNDD